jgi:hypothetical protein
MSKLIKITDNRYGESLRTGINGLLYDIPVNTEVKVEDALAEHLRGLGVAFDEPRASSKGASGSEEGSGDQLAPIALGFGGSSTVEAPAMRPKSVGQSGTQPGAVTSAGGGEEDEEAEGRTGAGQQDVIEAQSAVSDVRVKGERRSDQFASVAEIAGEGESGEPPASGTAGAASSGVQERARGKSGGGKDSFKPTPRRR